MIFIDSSYLVALLNDRDQFHEKAKKIESKIRKEKKIISSVILTETLNILSVFGGKTGKIIYNLINETHTIKYNSNKDFYDKVLEIFIKYDGTIGFSDCTSICIMKENNITKIVSFDSDFDKVNEIRRIY